MYNAWKDNKSARFILIVAKLLLNSIYTFIVILISFVFFLFVYPPSVDDRQRSTFVEELRKTSFANKNVLSSSFCRKETKRKYLNVSKPAIVIWDQRYKSQSEFIHQFEKKQCTVIEGTFGTLSPNVRGAYIFYASAINWRDLPLPRYPEQNIWILFHEESPKNVPELAYAKTLNLFNYSATFSRYSDIPFPLHGITSLRHITDKRHFVETSLKNRALKEISPILYFQSICLTLTERDSYVKELMKYQRIDSFGSCLKNKHSSKYSDRIGYDYMNKLWDDDIIKFIGRYKFMITIENGVCDDYITEKIWRALYAGVVPIYFGAPNIRDWLPNEKSAILIEDFPTPKLLSNHINKLMEEDDLYEEYLEHKLKGKISNKKLLKEIEERPYQMSGVKINEMLIRFACKKLHAKEEGVHIVTKSHYNCSKHVTITPKRQKSTDTDFRKTLHFWQSYWASARRVLNEPIY